MHGFALRAITGGAHIATAMMGFDAPHAREQDYRSQTPRRFFVWLGIIASALSCGAKSGVSGEFAFDPQHADGSIAQDGGSGADAPDAGEVIAPWTRQFGTSDADSASAIVVDHKGNFIVVGSTTGTFAGQTAAGSYDAYILKVDKRGTPLWIREFGTPQEDHAEAVSVDANDNIVVTGYTRGAFEGQISAGSDDAFVAKFDSTGNRLWMRQFGTEAMEFSAGVGVDANDNIIVAGATLGSSDEGAFVRKLDRDGNPLWTRTLGDTVSVGTLSVASDGTMVVGGSVSDALPGFTWQGSTDGFIRRYDSSGLELWTRQFGSSKMDQVMSVAADEAGIIVVGNTLGSFVSPTNPSGGTFILKFDLSGANLWARQDATTSRYAHYFAATDGKGNAILGGEIFDRKVGRDAFVRKIDAAGQDVWLRQFGTSEVDYATAGCVDPSGNVSVVGVTAGALPGQTRIGGPADAFIRQFDSAGN